MRRTSFHEIVLLIPILAACSIVDATDGGAIDSTPFNASGLGGAATDSSDAFDTTTVGDETTGEPVDAGSPQQYLTLCAPCHGTTGEGTERGYELRHPVRDYATWVVRNGRDGEELEDWEMDAFDASVLSDEDLEEIWDYLDAFPQPTTGEGLYLDYCRNCHGVDAEGGATEVSIDREGYGSIIETVRKGKHEGEHDELHEFMPAFDSTRLTEDEIWLIADHIDSL